MKKKDHKPIGVRMDPKLKKRLEQLAARQGSNLSSYIRKLALDAVAEADATESQQRAANAI